MLAREHMAYGGDLWAGEKGNRAKEWREAHPKAAKVLAQQAEERDGQPNRNSTTQIQR